MTIPMPEGCEEGIIKGICRYRSREVEDAKALVQLFGSGAILNGVLKLGNPPEQFGIASDAGVTVTPN